MRVPIDPNDLASHADAVRSLARALLGDVHRADDIVQDACVAALTTPPAAGAPPRAWFVRVVRNLAARTRRDDARRNRRERAAARPEAMPPDAHVASQIEGHRLLVEAVAALDDPYRSAIVLRFFDGLEPAEITARLGVPAATVRSWVHRGLAMLRDRLDGDRRDRLALLLLLAGPRRTPAPIGLVTGGLVMAAKKLTVAAVALLLLIGGAIGVRALMHRADDVASSSPPQGSAARTAHVPRAAGAAPVVDDVPPPVDLATVDRDLDLHGVVVDTAGAPVAGAAITTFTMPWRRTRMLSPMSMYRSTAPGPATRSAADGTFALRLRQGELVNLRATKDGVGDVETAACQAGERLRIVLRPAVTLAVTTVDAAGVPVAGTDVRVSEWATQIPGPDRTGTTGADGTCRVEALRPGAMVHVSLEPARHAAPTWTRVDLPESGTASVRVVLETGLSLRGRVTDAATNAPIAGASVGFGWSMHRAVTTDPDGRYELPGWLPSSGYFDLCCLAAGHASGRAIIGAEETIDFALRRGDRVVGRITGDGGAPVAGALLSVVGRDTGSGGEAARSGTSAADGTFALEGLAHDQPHSLIVVAEGRGRINLDFDPPPEAGGTRDLGEIALPAPRTLRGRVLAADGSAAAGVQVQIEGGNSDAGRLRPGRDSVSTLYGRTEKRRTDDLGRFAFPDLPPGGYTVMAIPDGARNAWRDVTLTAEADTSDVELRLAGGEPFTVTVVDSSGAPISLMGIGLTTSDQWSFSRATGTDGRAVFTPGAQVTSVTTFPWPGGRPFLAAEPVRPAAGTTEVRIVLEDAETVAGIVLGPQGKPVGQATLTVTCDGKPFVRSPFGRTDVWTDWTGRFEFLAPKGKKVDLALGGYARAAPTTMNHGGPVLTGELRGVAAGTRDVVLHAAAVANDRSLSVVVYGPDGEPEPGAEVSVYVMSATARAMVTASRSGRASFTDLPAAKSYVVARTSADNPHRADWLDATATDVVPEGQTIELSFRAGRRVAGVVVGPDGEPVAGATISLYREQKPFSERKSGRDGRFAIPAPLGEGAKLYLFVWARPDADRSWEFRDPAFRPDVDDVTIRLAPIER